MKNCACGHTADRHEIEQPYPCYECSCKAFERVRNLYFESHIPRGECCELCWNFVEKAHAQAKCDDLNSMAERGREWEYFLLKYEEYWEVWRKKREFVEKPVPVCERELGSCSCACARCDIGYHCGNSHQENRCFIGKDPSVEG